MFQVLQRPEQHGLILLQHIDFKGVSHVHKKNGYYNSDPKLQSAFFFHDWRKENFILLGRLEQVFEYLRIAAFFFTSLASDLSNSWHACPGMPLWFTLNIWQIHHTNVRESLCINCMGVEVSSSSKIRTIIRKYVKMCTNEYKRRD